jgi:hypothetical protein
MGWPEVEFFRAWSSAVVIGQNSVRHKVFCLNAGRSWPGAVAIDGNRLATDI